MKSNRVRTRILLSGMVLIMISVVLIAGGTYGLYSANASLTNHLQAGNLTVSLFRTSYEKKTLDGEGYLESASDSTVTEFTSATTENIFGLSSTDYIVPGSEFETNLEIRNSKTSGSTTTISTVAFTYTVNLDIGATSNDLVDQVTISYKIGNGDYSVAKKLSEFGSQSILSGSLKGQSADSAKFSIKLAFPDLDTNNNAQNETADFDLIISATQKTDRN